MRMTGLILILLAISFLACDRRPSERELPKSEGNSVDHSRIRNSTIVSSPNAVSAPRELQFLDTLAALDERTIDIAQLAQTRSGRESLKDLGRALIADRRAEIDQIQDLRSRYFAGSAPAVNADLPGLADAVANADLEKLDDLKETPFDKEFIRQIKSRNDGELRMAQELMSTAGGQDPNDMSSAVSQLAQTLHDKLRVEIGRMNEIADSIEN